MARDFPGTNGNALGLSNPTGLIDLTGTVATFAAWVKPDVATATARHIFAKSNANTGGRQYEFYLTPALVARYGDDGSPEAFVGATTIPASVWTHVAATRSGTGAGSVRLYVNGVLDATGNATKGITDSSSDFYIGRRAGWGANENNFDGTIAECAIWRAALSAAEIAALAKGASPLRIRPGVGVSGLCAYWPLWGAPGSVEPDLSGQGQHLTQSGSVAVVNHAPVQPPFGAL